jgi:cell fate regulator YaaT (PSP1 superfamily)
MPSAVDVTFRGGVRFRVTGPDQLQVEPGDFVVVRTSRGLELAQVRARPREAAEPAEGEARTIERKATEHDLRRAQELVAREQQALLVAAQKIAEYGLPMKLVSAEATLDGGRMVLHFSAEGRVDFRALVRDLARALRTRIELHQVGVRDEAKMRGGLGPCGRVLCCASFLAAFAPVGIKMAKEQDLSLNPQKISGVCGRLMCCLNYEYGHYRDSRRCLPKIGSTVQTEKGPGRIAEVNVLRDQVMVSLEEGGRLRGRGAPPRLPAPVGRAGAGRGAGRSRARHRAGGRGIASRAGKFGPARGDGRPADPA